MALTFHCKDPLVARYYERLFGQQFAAEWAMVKRGTKVEKEGIQASWQSTMLAEARRQQHYDYGINVMTGRKVPILEKGQPRLLIPTVEVG